MASTSENRTKNETVVYESLLLTLAAAVCNQLESAGLPARLSPVDKGFAVLVAVERAVEAGRLLNARPHAGEILLYRGPAFIY
jgi:hypothetical protein